MNWWTEYKFFPLRAAYHVVWGKIESPLYCPIDRGLVIDVGYYVGNKDKILCGNCLYPSLVPPTPRELTYWYNYRNLNQNSTDAQESLNQFREDVNAIFKNFWDQFKK